MKSFSSDINNSSRYCQYIHETLSCRSSLSQCLFRITHLFRLVSTDIGLPSAAPLLRGYAKVETLTISELNEFIIIAPTRDIDLICIGKVISIKVEKDGVMLLAPVVPKKLQRTPHSISFYMRAK